MSESLRPCADALRPLPGPSCVSPAAKARVTIIQQACCDNRRKKAGTTARPYRTRKKTYLCCMFSLRSLLKAPLVALRRAHGQYRECGSENRSSNRDADLDQAHVARAQWFQPTCKYPNAVLYGRGRLRAAHLCALEPSPWLVLGHHPGLECLRAILKDEKRKEGGGKAALAA